VEGIFRVAARFFDTTLGLISASGSGGVVAGARVDKLEGGKVAIVTSTQGWEASYGTRHVATSWGVSAQGEMVFRALFALLRSGEEELGEMAVDELTEGLSEVQFQSSSESESLLDRVNVPRVFSNGVEALKMKVREVVPLLSGAKAREILPEGPFLDDCRTWSECSRGEVIDFVNLSSEGAGRRKEVRRFRDGVEREFVVRGLTAREKEFLLGRSLEAAEPRWIDPRPIYFRVVDQIPRGLVRRPAGIREPAVVELLDWFRKEIGEPSGSWMNSDWFMPDIVSWIRWKGVPEESVASTVRGLLRRAASEVAEEQASEVAAERAAARVMRLRELAAGRRVRL
jgi:hypothetical protein